MWHLHHHDTSSHDSDTESGDDEQDSSFIDEGDAEEKESVAKRVKGYAGIKPRIEHTAQLKGFDFHFLNGYVCQSDGDLHVDSHSLRHLHACRVLSVLDQFYWPGIGIICRQHKVKQIVPIRNWPTHMRNLHLHQLLGCSPTNLQEMANHLMSTHLLSGVIDVLLPKDISYPIPILDSLPTPYYVCPHCSQLFPGPGRSTVNAHVHDNHGSFQVQLMYEQRYAQRLYIYNCPQGMFHTFTLHRDWAGIVHLPPAQLPTAFQPKPDVAPPEVSYLQETGWPSYIASLHASPRKLVLLVEVPFAGLVKRKKWQEEQWVEEGLWQCHQANFVYIKSAIDFAFSRHRDLRKLLVCGSVVPYL
jgi:hypothetical protein